MQQTSHAPASSPIRLTLPDGSVRTFDTPVTGLDLATSIGAGLAKAAIAVKLDGEMRDLLRPIEKDAKVEIITRKSAEALDLIRHDTAHILAEAVQELFPGTQVTIGPNIENGFYYDFARDVPFSTDDFSAIEAKMREIIARDVPLVREVWDRNEAIKFFESKGEKYKAELIRDLPETETITVYSQGAWKDLCRGPHMPSTGKIGTSFKLLKLAGAYWRGDSKNAMLQRIYGTAWRDDKELQTHLTQIEEAEKRDHRKIGKELDLFHFQDEAAGSVFWHPKGWTMYRALEAYIRRRVEKAGYVEVNSPQLYDSSLFKASGHWDLYGDNMFKIAIKEADKPQEARMFGIKPMNCPGHVQIFKQGIKSYRDLPLRLAEFGMCHRNEAHGALHGLMRVRQFVQDDAHIFCTEDQIQSESLQFCELLRSVYADLGFEVARVRLADRPERRTGSDEIWDKSEAALHSALKAANLAYDINTADGAFYGPKLEFYLRDAIGREWQCGTLQVDFNTADRLGGTYVGEDGQKRPPVMLHRAILGTFHRFLGIFIEHCAGKFPLWLTPVQAVICTITNDADGYAAEAYDTLTAAGLRVQVDTRPEKINAKIRDHSLQKIPLILVVGQKEAEGKSVAIRRLGGETQEIMGLAEAATRLAQEALPPDLR
ncbi:MAG: threonine--tRNA ligase [Alphaproteobacteria bacterium]|nr:threonine--tRNA ligase [Alphaproteobacteria bacterium]MBV8548666.1 threonine--tRNA ligase [Alphaproteobacteria bacterium]